MTDVKKLLDEATPLPWHRTGGGAEIDDVALIDEPADAALIVHAVNHLPQYEDLREAAGLLADSVRRYHEGETKAIVNIQPLTERVEAILKGLDA